MYTGLANEPHPSDPCPCLAGLPASGCCLQKDGTWLKGAANTCPPGPKTGIISPGCYASPLMDCDGERLSSEHFISHSLLKQIDSTVRLEGVPWSTGKPIQTASMVSNILCKRHNLALSPLDKTAGHLFGMINSFHGLSTSQNNWLLLNGEDIERWMIKTLFGIFASKNFQSRDGAPSAKRLPPLIYLEMLFGTRDMPREGGLRYFDALSRQSQLVITPTSLSTTTEGIPRTTVFGIRVGLLGFNIHFSFGPLPSGNAMSQVLHYRPKRFYLGPTAAIDIYWRNPAYAEAIILGKY